MNTPEKRKIIADCVATLQSQAKPDDSKAEGTPKNDQRRAAPSEKEAQSKKKKDAVVRVQCIFYILFDKY